MSHHGDQGFAPITMDVTDVQWLEGTESGSMDVGLDGRVSDRWNENRLTQMLGIDYPIIQGPLGGLASQRLTAAVSNFGGLGSFGAHRLWRRRRSRT